jgi:hypothetical protein
MILVTFPIKNTPVTAGRRIFRMAEFFGDVKGDYFNPMVYSVGGTAVLPRLVRMTIFEPSGQGKT